jgi:hypothetical protein
MLSGSVEMFAHPALLRSVKKHKEKNCNSGATPKKEVQMTVKEERRAFISCTYFH